MIGSRVLFALSLSIDISLFFHLFLLFLLISIDWTQFYSIFIIHRNVIMCQKLICYIVVTLQLSQFIYIACTSYLRLSVYRGIFSLCIYIVDFRCISTPMYFGKRDMTGFSGIRASFLLFDLRFGLLTFTFRKKTQFLTVT